MDFVKMHGLGNDFVVFEGPAPAPGQIRRWCDRRTGIGADGVLRLGRASGGHSGAAARMEYWNADGGAAEMCGNGLRCAAAYAYERGWAGRGEFLVDTPIGIRRAEVLDGGMVRVEIGPCRVGAAFDFEGRSFTAADAGNPHAVTFLDSSERLDEAPVGSVGPALQSHPSFPEGVNVEFVSASGAGLRLRVWERGAGETRACGTGAAAAAAAARHLGLAGRVVQAELPGGILRVELADGAAWIEGPAVRVFSGAVPA